MERHRSRRAFLQNMGKLVGVSAAVSVFSMRLSMTEKNAKGAVSAPEISPAEDLMREHGVLSRILLIYEEILRRMRTDKELPASALAGSAGIVRRFIENYHEKLEEDYLFPRFREKGMHADLVKILLDQHRAGRRLTGYIMSHVGSSNIKEKKIRGQIANYLSLFTRMYRPHKAREDTVLFPAIRAVFSPSEYADLGEKFEDKERELFGENGFEKMVFETSAVEKALEIYDLSKFTPKL
ncbi:MAG: hemerythrin domain-containing protein [Syntrophales bacterium]